MLVAPRERLVSCSQRALMEKGVGSHCALCHDLAGNKSLLQPAVGTILAAGEFGPQQEEIASVSPSNTFPSVQQSTAKASMKRG